MPECRHAFATTFGPAMARVRIGRHGNGTAVCADKLFQGCEPLVRCYPRPGGQPLRDRSRWRGAANAGVVYNVDTAGHERLLYRFKGAPDVANPLIAGATAGGPPVARGAASTGLPGPAGQEARSVISCLLAAE